MKAKGRILLVLTAIIFSLAGVCVKSVTWGPLPIIAAKSLLTFVLFSCINRSFKIKFTKKNILIGIFNAGAAMSEIIAIKLTTAGNAIVLQYIAPILVFLFAVIFKGKKANIIQISLTALIFGGIVLAFASDLDATHILGNGFALLDGFLYAGFLIMSNDGESSVIDGMKISTLLSFLVTSPFLFMDDSVVFDAPNIIWLLVLGLVQFGLGNFIFSRGIKLVDGVEGSLILTLEPVLNPIIVALVCGEHMNALGIIGAAIVIAGVTAYTLLSQKSPSD